jgi:hypothetical protein
MAAWAWQGVCIDVGARVLALMFCISHKRQVDCGLMEDLTY